MINAFSILTDSSEDQCHLSSKTVREKIQKDLYYWKQVTHHCIATCVGMTGKLLNGGNHNERILSRVTTMLRLTMTLTALFHLRAVAGLPCPRHTVGRLTAGLLLAWDVRQCG
jgi:hypothetical protein